MTFARSPVQVSLFLTNQNPVGWNQSDALAGQLELFRWARDNGWNGILSGQHFLATEITHLQPLPFLARVAGESATMRVGIGVLLLSLENPVEVAESYASLDALCGGRLIFGVGLGYRHEEYAAFGVPQGEGAHRFEVNLGIVTSLWSGEPVTVDVPWCRLENRRIGISPVQKPRPPIWIAANSDAAVRRAARLGDAWFVNPHATRPTVLRQLDLYRRTRIEFGRSEFPDELPLMREIFCAVSREAAFAAAGPYLARKYEVYSAWGQDRVLPTRDNFTVPIDTLAAQRFLLGSPDECVEELVRWRDDVGVNHFVFRTDWAGMDPELAVSSMRLLTEEVLPALRGG
jgi:alkanesulfonate monooxygenase SsuD/methylene tetrahydromethanopterin reductase-like flavin-dependent oxidoreductase (luciferase family)